ncbi:zinc finger BED domain-containing protein RICESLEEPER 2-like [Spinacia oleracea]|uniref:Zinc finger BED domain-containing protein RICESLEEPER 2-like n=1 Tax=Spinacia oleracea TaxID=3562 RepID=A0ABM3RRZ8_SPIOL|nr:zinc finger BED domain-containing protein RICESLEEPER 2-like [Spinacia oleracea]
MEDMCQAIIGTRCPIIFCHITTYNDVMVSTLKKRLVPKGGLLDGEALFHVRCCAHIINLIVQKGLSCISEILDKIRALTKMVPKPSHRGDEFYDCAEKIFHLNGKRKLNLDMQDEWEKVSVIHNFLELFYEVTCMFSVMKYPTANLYFKGAWMVHRHLFEAENGPHVFLKEIVQPMLIKFDKYWSEYNLYLSCTAILDPRYKVKFVEYCFSKLLGSDEALRRLNLVLATMKSLFIDYKLQYASSSLTIVSPSPATTLGSKNYFDDYDHFVGTSTRSQVGKSPLEMYLHDDALDLNSELDVLEFWHQSSVRYPVVSKMARDLLIIPISLICLYVAVVSLFFSFSFLEGADVDAREGAAVWMSDLRNLYEYNAMLRDKLISAQVRLSDLEKHTSFAKGN